MRRAYVTPEMASPPSAISEAILVPFPRAQESAHKSVFLLGVYFLLRAQYTYLIPVQSLIS